MKIAELKNHFVATARGKRSATTIGQGHSLAMLELVLNCVSCGVMELDINKKHPARELCHPEIWRSLSRAERLTAGICLAYLVDAGALGLRMHVTPSGKGSKSYWICSTPT